MLEPQAITPGEELGPTQQQRNMNLKILLQIPKALSRITKIFLVTFTLWVRGSHPKSYQLWDPAPRVLQRHRYQK